VMDARVRGSYVNAYGKLKPGVSVRRAVADLAAIEAALTREFPETNRGNQPLVEPFTKPFIGEEPSRPSPPKSRVAQSTIQPPPAPL